MYWNTRDMQYVYSNRTIQEYRISDWNGDSQTVEIIERKQNTQHVTEYYFTLMPISRSLFIRVAIESRSWNPTKGSESYIKTLDIYLP